jgi:hypothetical protein
VYSTGSQVSSLERSRSGAKCKVLEPATRDFFLRQKRAHLISGLISSQVSGFPRFLLVTTPQKLFVRLSGFPCVGVMRSQNAHSRCGCEIFGGLLFNSVDSVAVHSFICKKCATKGMGVGGIIFFWLTPGRVPPVRFLSALIVRLQKELIGKVGGRG